jgi:RHS repeat-associated protein
MTNELTTQHMILGGQISFFRKLLNAFLPAGLLAILLFGAGNVLAQGFSSESQKKDSGNKADQNMRSIAKVNPSTLAMEFSLPFMSYPGRNGNAMSVGLSYSSKVWRMDDLFSWSESVPYSCNMHYMTVLNAKYGERSISGWTSNLTPPVIEENFKIYDMDGKQYGNHVDPLAITSLFQELEENYQDIFHSLTSNPNIPCGWFCAESELPSPENPTPNHCLRWDYNVCTPTGGGGGGEPGTGCPNPNPNPSSVPLYTVKRVYVRTSDGASHEFREGDSHVQCGNSASGCQNTSNGTYLSVDGSGMKLKRDSNGSTLFMPNGSKYVFPATAQHTGADATGLFYANEFTDADGNKTNYSETVVENKVYPQQTDTMGRQLTDPLPQNFGSVSQVVKEQNLSFPGLNGTQDYKLVWKRLKPHGCEDKIDATCGDGDGALEHQDEKLYYDTNLKCNGNASEPISGTNEFLFTQHDVGLRSCSSFRFEQDENGNVNQNPARFNPIVLAVIVLPNGKNYEFRYNQWGEITKITYPTGSYETFKYDKITPVNGENSVAYDQTNRGVIERKVFSRNSNGAYVLEQYWKYSSSIGKITTIASKGDSASTEGIKTERFVYTDTSSGEFGFSDPLAGMPAEEKTYDELGNVRSRTLTDWTTKDGKRDARVTRSISVMIEGGQALATLSENEYETPGQNGSTAPTDAEYFAHLNVKRSKSYHYAVISLNMAQTGTLAQIAAYFNQNLLASVSETDYQYNADYKARGVSSLPVETRVLNPANTADVIAKTQTIFDEPSYLVADSGNLSGNLANTWTNPATDQSIPPNSQTLRMKPTTTKLWNKDTNSWIQTHTQYDQYGNVRKVWKPDENTSTSTQFAETEYSSDYAFAYPTRVITPAPDATGTHGTNQTSQATTTYDFTTGLPLTVTDDYGQTVKTEYNDSMLRPTRVSGVGNFVIPVSETIYDDNALTVKVRKQIDANNWDEATTFMDTLGRAVKTQSKDSQGDVFSETEYDLLGRVKRTTNPYRTGDAKLWSKPRYDELGRAVESYAPALDGQTGDSLGVTEYGISTAPGYIGTYVTTTDAASKKNRAITNALGQLLRVDEPDSTGSVDALPQSTPVPNPSPTPPPNPPGGGGCYNRDPYSPPTCRGSGNGSFESLATVYRYNAQGKMVMVAQGEQRRFFLYDSLGRLIRVRQPEQEVNATLDLADSVTGNGQWTAGFTYDVLGNVLTTKDANGTITANTYDQAGRVTTKSYSNEPSGMTTPAVEYFYDGKGLDNQQSPNFAKGKLTKVTSSVSETRYTVFDNFGRLTQSEQRTPVDTETISNAPARVSMYQYNFSGALVQQTYPSGRTVTNEFESDGDLSRISGKANSNSIERTYANSFSYMPDGRIEKLRLGNNRWESAKFNTRLQVTELALGFGPNNGSLWKLNYEYGELHSDGTTVTQAKNTGNIAKQTVSFSGLTQPFVQTFKYDSLYRLTEARETSGTSTTAPQTWKQTFNYDRFGNRMNFSQQVGQTQLTIDNQTLPDIDPATNRFKTTDGYIYDKNGNLLNDPLSGGRTFTFNGENKQTIVKDASNQPIGRYFYDGEGKRVKKITNLETTVFVYDGLGKMVAEYSTATPPTNPTTSYTATDQLDSPRVITDSNGNVVSRRDFMPFGEELYADGVNRNTANKYSLSSQDAVRQRFTGYQKDTETNLDFAEARYYNNAHARFTAVDPLLASGKSADPQTFNRYVYCLNNPLVLTDPTGLFGDFYNYKGNYLGSDDNKTDGKVYFAQEVARRKTKKGTEVDLVNWVVTTREGVFAARHPTIAAITNEQALVRSFPANPYEQAWNGFVTGLKNIPGTLWNAGIDSSHTSLLGLTSVVNFDSLKVGTYGCNTQITCSWSGGTTNAAIIAPGVVSGVFGAGASTELGLGNSFESPAVSETFGNCFIAGTLIHTEKGLVAIEKIKAGDKVLSYNEDIGQVEYQDVVRLFRNTADEFLKIQVEGEAEPITVTLGHPFYVHQNKDTLSANSDDEGDWILSKDLQVGNLLRLPTGEWRPIVNIRIVQQTQTTYNFEVEKNHDYFVGRNGWLVHNQSLKFDPNRAGHIFREADGHVSPLTQSSKDRFVNLFKNVGEDSNNFRLDLSSRPDKAAANVNIFTRNFNNGQVWVEVRNSIIQNAGVSPPGFFR